VTGIPDREGDVPPILIHAEALREWRGAPDTCAMLGFAMADELPGKPDETRPRGEWLEADVQRAIRAAEEAGLSAYRIEIAPDGTIAIVVGTTGSGAGHGEPPAPK
jgi:hypothetical protein